LVIAEKAEEVLAVLKEPRKGSLIDPPIIFSTYQTTFVITTFGRGKFLYKGTYRSAHKHTFMLYAENLLI